ncbi:MAG: GNAT family N-acetyltransferase [Actinobacteria bacterium]|nr:GNAT family N-acetyltransferase [Actinomycetota bacterium]MCA1721228.1 GNAT family N-acetyltransferase [Actinomycetota bacterium]
MTAAQVLGRAFSDDPVFGWLLAGRPNPDRRLTRVFGAFVDAADRTPDAQVLATEQAASIWRPPGAWKAGGFDVLRSGPRLVRAFGPGLVRSLRLLSAVERAHPAEPHWYLEAVGVVPEARGRGLGGPMLTPVLERCDTAGLPAYLESSNPRNIAFYERHGFQIRPLFDLPAGCPVITPMWRDPR